MISVSVGSSILLLYTANRRSSVTAQFFSAMALPVGIIFSVSIPITCQLRSPYVLVGGFGGREFASLACSLIILKMR
jgi:hypothetical protein